MCMCMGVSPWVVVRVSMFVCICEGVYVCMCEGEYVLMREPLCKGNKFQKLRVSLVCG